MPVHRGNIGEVVLKAWEHARCADIECSDRQKANSERSRIWIGSLAKRFGEHYAGKRHRIFWSGNDGSRKQFKMNELLFDLAVCSVSETNSLQKNGEPLQFIAQCHWQIESEFSRGTTRDIVVDMSKLVMGSAEHKLFIAAHRGVREKDILEQCASIARCCGGRVYFGFVSHPDDWKEKPDVPPALHEWIAGGWAEIALLPAS